ncbi:unnamed protein product [Rotaria socialis]
MDLKTFARRWVMILPAALNCLSTADELQGIANNKCRIVRVEYSVVVDDAQEVVMGDAQEVVMGDAQEVVMGDAQEVVMGDAQEVVMGDAQEVVVRVKLGDEISSKLDMFKSSYKCNNYLE